MIRAYDDNGNVVDLVKWEKQIRAEERVRAIDEISNDIIDNLKNGYNYPNEEFKDALINVVYDAFVDVRNKMKGEVNE